MSGIDEIAHERHNNAIIVLSSLEGDRIREMGLRAGAVQFLSKSDVTPDNLENCIKETSVDQAVKLRPQRKTKRMSPSTQPAKEPRHRADWSSRLAPSAPESLNKKSRWADFTNFASLLRDSGHVPLPGSVEEKEEVVDARCDLASQVQKFVNGKHESSQRLQITSYPSPLMLATDGASMQKVFGLVADILQNGMAGTQTIRLESQHHAEYVDLVFSVEKFTNFHNAQLALLKTQRLLSIENFVSDQDSESLIEAKRILATVGGTIKFNATSSFVEVILRFSSGYISPVKN
jgi:hypothetical protein